MECTNNIRYGFVNGFKIAQLELKGQKICEKYISTIQIQLYIYTKNMQPEHKPLKKKSV
jgi:hypothetical protein